MINTSLFPYSSFPIRLEHDDKQKGSVTCFFQCEDHLENYLNRGKLDKKKCVILRANDQSVKPSPVVQKSKVNEQLVKPLQKDKKQIVSRPKKMTSENTNISGKQSSNLNTLPRKRGRPRKNTK